MAQDPSGGKQVPKHQTKSVKYQPPVEVNPTIVSNVLSLVFLYYYICHYLCCCVNLIVLVVTC